MVIKSSAVGAETRRPAEQRAATFQGGDNEMVAAYTYLQRAVAIIAVLLPGSLVVGHRLFGGELLGSISAYYYTHMGNVFVGSLCALAVFFLSYSHRRVRAFELDNLLSRAACVAAVGVAVFPHFKQRRRRGRRREAGLDPSPRLCGCSVRSTRCVLALPLHEDE